MLASSSGLGRPALYRKIRGSNPRASAKLAAFVYVWLGLPPFKG